VSKVRVAAEELDSTTAEAPSIPATDESPAEAVTESDEKPLKKLRRFWWRKRPTRTKPSSPPPGKGEPTSGSGEA